MVTGDVLLTVDEVSAYLRLSNSTVYRLTRQGALPAKKVGGAWRFSLRAIEAWIQQPNNEQGAANVARPREGVDFDSLS